MKIDGLRTLSRVTCKLAGRNWTKECDELLIFYDIQKKKLETVSNSLEEKLNDLHSQLRSESEMSYLVKKQIQDINENNKKSVATQVTIRKIHQGVERD